MFQQRNNEQYHITRKYAKQFMGAYLSVMVLFKVSLDWALLSRFHMKTEAESGLRNVVFCIKIERRVMSRNTIIVSH
jgi:hypothetical protein